MAASEALIVSVSDMVISYLQDAEGITSDCHSEGRDIEDCADLLHIWIHSEEALTLLLGDVPVPDRSLSLSVEELKVADFVSGCRYTDSVYSLPVVPSYHRHVSISLRP